MRAVVQRVKRASVTVDGKLISAIDTGFLVLLGICRDDTDKDLDLLVHKITNLRVFEDENEKMNLALKDVNGKILAVSQFTLCASVKKGNRPGFEDAMAPEPSEKMYLDFVRKCNDAGIETLPGIFGADMKVELLNDGPVTILYDTKDLH
ncbi:MAG: D-tyrosyl-tRNA(Tyr) deacylase [Lachnospiraceae bacterium]|nr:D-tyrosyl-tRNA(Tyr) deacylase [Lachnospiraceae bacterium]